MKVFAFGGLGVDKKVFENFNLNYELIVIEWLTLKIKESFDQYILRLSKMIPTDSPFVLLGVSFGGMVVVELSKILNPELTVIISSVSRRVELPWIYRFVGKTGIISWIPPFLLKPPVYLAYYFFGVNSKPHKTLLKGILENTDLKFLRWAINNITRWENEAIPNHLFRIHGTKDRVLPLVDGVDSVTIERGGHFMIVTHSERIAQIINDKIGNKL